MVYNRKSYALLDILGMLKDNPQYYLQFLKLEIDLEIVSMLKR
jgi:hypothetical protein